MSKKALQALVPVAAVFALMLSLLAPASAQGNGNGPGNNNGKKDNQPICDVGDTGRIHPAGSVAVINFPADAGWVIPAGQFITGYCVKSGTDGSPEYTEVDYQSSVIITFDGSKEISHYSVEFGTPTPVTQPPTTQPPSTQPPTTAEPDPDPEPEADPDPDPSGVLGAGAANAQVGAPSFTG